MKLKHIFPTELQIILLGFVLIGFAYMWATPPFEASDELRHFGMVEYIRETGELPVQDPEQPDTPYHQEGSQPPLYYALVALITRPISFDGLDALREYNPHAKLGIPGDPDNKNMVLHLPSRPPLQDALLAVYVGRLFSLLVAGVAITAVYHSARILAPDGRLRRVVPLVAAGLTAFNPMLIFIAASVNNDNLVTMLNSLVILLMLLMLRDGFDWRRSLLISVLIALATLTKLSGLVLVPVVALAGLWLGYRRRDLRGLFTLGFMMAGIWVLLAGWWYLRNIQLYGELFGTETMVAVVGPRLEPFTVQTLINEFEGFRLAFWGLFGSVNIWVHDVFYRAMDAVSLLATIGFAGYLWGLWRNRSQEEVRLVSVMLMVLMLVVASMSLISWTAQTLASQGRLLFPVIAAISILSALGLAHLPEYFAAFGRARRDYARPFGWFRPVAIVAVAGLAMVAAISPFVVIAPVYAIPQPVGELSNSATPVYARYGDTVELIGYETEDRRYEPGDRIPVTLYWRALEQTDTDYSLFVHAVDSSGAEIGKVDSYPGAGLLRTSMWEPGAIYRDEYLIPLDEDAEGRVNLRLQVGWWDIDTEERLIASDGTNDGVSVFVDTGGFVGDSSLEIDGFTMLPETVDFGGVISLKGYTLVGDSLMLLWAAIGIPNDSYTVFAQVLSEANVVVGQGDAPPSLPTRYWRNGEQYITQHTLHYADTPPDGAYRLLVGWYHPADFARLSTAVPGDAYEVTTITFEDDS